MLLKVEILRWESVISFYDPLDHFGHWLTVWELRARCVWWTAVWWTAVRWTAVRWTAVWWCCSPTPCLPSQPSASHSGPVQSRHWNISTQGNKCFHFTLSHSPLSPLSPVSTLSLSVARTWWQSGVGWKCCDKLLTLSWLTDVARWEADSGLKTGQAVERPAVQWVEWSGVRTLPTTRTVLSAVTTYSQPAIRARNFIERNNTAQAQPGSHPGMSAVMNEQNSEGTGTATSQSVNQGLLQSCFTF